MELKIYAPTKESAEQMEKRVFDNPVGAYRNVLNSFIQGYLTAVSYTHLDVYKRQIIQPDKKTKALRVFLKGLLKYGKFILS